MSKPAAATSASPASKAPPLTGKQKRHLRALAHGLEPVVLLGQKGLTPAVLREIDGALTAHELIKVKLPKEPSSEQASPTETPPEVAIERAPEAAIERALAAHCVQRIGHLLVLYRAHPQRPRIALPRS